MRHVRVTCRSLLFHLLPLNDYANNMGLLNNIQVLPTHPRRQRRSLSHLIDHVRGTYCTPPPGPPGPASPKLPTSPQHFHIACLPVITMAEPPPPKNPLQSPLDAKHEIPNLSLNTSTESASPAPQTAAASPGSASPPPPPISPITPTLGPADKATVESLPPRQTFAHAQPNQVGVPPPPPKPIFLDENPDALALRSAIAVLQMQKRKAESDLVTLHKAKEAAVEDVHGFVKDLGERKVQSGGGVEGEGEKPWSQLPARQDVVRCPPINWSQYAVVGESLDKLHAEQRATPNLGVPATMGPGGTYEFKGEGERRELVGVAAPYTPGRDKVDKKNKGPKK